MSKNEGSFDDEGGTLVEEGVFKVDRKRALEKLMRYQLPDPAMFVLLLVRCAVASGATRIQFRAKPGGLGTVVRFNGEPFDADSLRQPYGSLFSRASKTVRRDRQLSIAILSILRLKPKWITVRSGNGKSRVLLRVSSVTDESLEPAVDGNQGTVITIFGLQLGKAHEELLRSRCRLSPIPIIFLNDPLPRNSLRSRISGRYVFNEEGVRGWIGFPEKSNTHSFLRASRYGVYVSNVRYRLPVGQVIGSFNADGLSVSASQFGLLKNSRYKKSLAVIGRQVEAFANQELAHLTHAIPKLRSLLFEKAHRRYWCTILAASSQREGDRGLLTWFGDVVGSLSVEQDVEQYLTKNAQRIGWLREAARHLCLGDKKKTHPELRQRLWKAPLFLSSRLTSLSLEELDSQRHRIGYVPTTKTAFPGLKTSFDALWLGGPKEDDMLERFFPLALSDASVLLAQEQKYGISVRGRPKLERLGLASLLTRLPIFGKGLDGEIALPFHRFPQGARVHAFDLGRPDSYVDVPGCLHYAAAVEGPLQHLKAEVAKSPREIPSQLKEEVLTLYRRAAEEFEIKQLGEPREDSLRAHLIDFLLWAARREGGVFKEHAWVTQVPLFKQQGRVSWTFRRLYQSYTAGETLYFAPSGNKARAFPGSLLFVGEQFNEEIVAALFPGCSLKHFPGRKAVLMIYKPAKSPGAIASVSIGTGRFEAAPGQGKGGLAVKAPFGDFRIFGETSSLSGVDSSVGARLVSGFLREHGSLGLKPESPLRQWLLNAVGALFAPWPGKAFESEDLRHAMELLVEFPMFRRPEGEPWTIAELHSRFGRKRKLSMKEIVLDGAEWGLIRQLWPKEASRLLKMSAPKTKKKKRAKKTSKTESASPPVPEAPKPAESEHKVLSFSTPMIYERQLEAENLRVLVGLPFELLPGLSVVIRRDGNSQRYIVHPKGLSAAASLFIDADDWRSAIEAGHGVLHPQFEKAVFGVYNRFMYGLLDTLPKSDVNSHGYDSLLLYLLFHLRGDDRSARSTGPQWSPLRQRIRSSSIVPLLGGGRASIDELAARAKETGSLVYVDDRAVDRGDDSDDIPVFRYSRLAAQVLGGVKMKRYKKTPKTKERAELDEQLLAKFTPEQRLQNRFRGIFEGLNGRRGLDFDKLPKLDTFKLVDSKSDRVTPGLYRGRLRVNKGNPLVAKILQTPISPEAKAEYLASLIFTEINRKEKNLTDLEDSRFQRCLAYDVNKRET